MREVVIHCMIYAEPGYRNESKEDVLGRITDVLNANNCSISVFQLGEQETGDDD